MSKLHHYKITVNWTGNTGSGTANYNAYERSHEVVIKGKKKLQCSSDSPFNGDKKKHCPEELFIASLSSCHMLWFLRLCASEGVVVEEYTDSAEAKMIQTSNGSGYFTEASLNPKIILSERSMHKKALDLFKKAGSYCFIANSVKFPVYLHPEFSFKDISA